MGSWWSLLLHSSNYINTTAFENASIDATNLKKRNEKLLENKLNYIVDLNTLCDFGIFYENYFIKLNCLLVPMFVHWTITSIFSLES